MALNTYVTRFLKYFVAGSKNAASNYIVSSTGAILKPLVEWMNEKKTASLLTENILQSLLNNIDQVIEEDLPREIPQYIDNSQYCIEITADVFNDIYNNAKLAILSAGEDYGRTNDGFTLVDSDGYTYAVQMYADGDFMGLATCYNPINGADFFIYHDLTEDKYYMNPYLKSLGYFREGLPNPAPKTIDGCLNGIIDWLDAFSVSATIDGKVRDICLHLSLTTTSNIFANVEAICTHYGHSMSGDILDALQWIYLHVAELYDTNYGVIGSITDIIRSVAVSSSLDEIMVKCIEFMTRGYEDLASLSSAIAEHIKSSCKQISDFARGALDAFMLGGFYGLACYIADALRGVATIEVSSNGMLEFTDNEALVPKQYIASVVCTIANTAINLVSSLVSFIYPAVAGILSVVGSIILAVPKAIAFDWEENTAASINLDERQMTLPVAPGAICQLEIPMNTVSGKVVFNMLANGPGYCEVPGGTLLLSRDVTTDDYPSTIRVEFHPNMGKYDIVSILDPGSTFSRDIEDDEHGGLILDAWCANLKHPENWTAEHIQDAWASITPPTINTEPDGDLSASDDVQLRRNVLSNTGVFCLFLCLLQNPNFIAEALATNRIPIAHGGVAGARTLYCSGLGDTISWVFCNHGNWVSDIPSWNTIASVFSQNGKETNAILSYFTQPFVSQTWMTEVVFSTSIKYCLNNRMWYGLMQNLPAKFNYGFNMPKYDRDTFLLWVALTTVVVAVATAVTVVSAISIKKWRQRKRAKLTSDVANAWDDYSKSMKEYDPLDPDDRPELHTDAARAENYKTYYKRVKKNNRWSLLTGGTKYSTAGYWDSDGSTSVIESGGTIEERISDNLPDEYSQDIDGQSSKNMAIESGLNLDNVIILIKGQL